MNAKQLAIIRLALVIAIWPYAFDNPLERSIYGWVSGMAIVLAIITVNIEHFIKIGSLACQAFTTIGEITANFFVTLYTIVIIEPMQRRYRAREDNYKEIIRSLQKELSREEVVPENGKQKPLAKVKKKDTFTGIIK